MARRPRYARLPEAQARAAGHVRAQLERVIGADGSGVEVRIEDGIPHAATIDCAEALPAEVMVVGAPMSRLGHEAERVVRYAHGPVWVVRTGPPADAVLVATDLSDAAFPAIAAGVALARQRRAALHLLHVVDVRLFMVQADFGLGVAVPWTPELESSLVTRARARFRKALGPFRANGSLIVETGEPAAVILEQAARLPANVIVLGTAGTTGVSQKLLFHCVAQSAQVGAAHRPAHGHEHVRAGLDQHPFVHGHVGLTLPVRFVGQDSRRKCRHTVEPVWQESKRALARLRDDARHPDLLGKDLERQPHRRSHGGPWRASTLAPVLEPGSAWETSAPDVALPLASSIVPIM